MKAEGYLRGSRSLLTLHSSWRFYLNITEDGTYMCVFLYLVFLSVFIFFLIPSSWNILSNLTWIWVS